MKTICKKFIGIISIASILAGMSFYFEKIDNSITHANPLEQGNPATAVFTVSDVSSGYQLGDFDMDSDYFGNQIHVWSEIENGGSCVSYYYKKISHRGNQINSEKTPLTGTMSHCNGVEYSKIRVASDNYGNFVVAYDHSNSIAFIEAYNKSGSLRGARQQIQEVKNKSFSLDIKKDLPENENIIGVVYETNGSPSSIVLKAYLINFQNNNSPSVLMDWDSNTNFILSQSQSSIDYSKPDFAFSNMNNDKIESMVTFTRNNTLDDSKQIFATPVQFDKTDGPTYYTIIQLSDQTAISPNDFYADNSSIIGLNRKSSDNTVTGIYKIAWEGEGASDPHGIYMRKIACVIENCSTTNSINSTNSVVVRVNTITNGKQSNPQITAFTQNSNTTRSGSSEAAVNDYFTVSWYDESVSPAQIIVQKYHGNMARLGNSFIIATNASMNTENSDKKPKISMDNDGDFTVSFKDTPGDLKARSYFSNIYKRIPEHTFSDSGYGQTAVTAVGKNGNTAVVYSYPDGNGNGIMLSLFDKYGTQINKLHINEDRTEGDQYVGGVAFFNDNEESDHYGKFIVTWTGYFDFNNENAIMYRIFSADGTPETPTTLITGSNSLIYSNSKVQAADYDNFIIGFFIYNEPNYSLYYYAKYDKNFSTGPISSTTFTYPNKNYDMSLNPKASSLFEKSFQTVFTWEQSSDPISYFREITILTEGQFLMHGQSAIIPTSSSIQGSPRVKMLGIGENNPYYIIIFNGKDSGEKPSIRANVFRTCGFGGCPEGGSFPAIILTDEIIKEQSYGHFEENFYPLSISASFSEIFPFVAKIFLTWTSTADPMIPGGETLEFNVQGQFLKFLTQPSTIIQTFGPDFTINGNRGAPNDFWNASVDYNSDPLNSENSVASAVYTSTSPNFQTYFQLLNDPFAIGINQNLQPQISQEIINRGKFISVPTSLQFGEMEKGETITINGPVEIIDYDGGSNFHLTVSLDSLTHSGNETLTISKENFKIRNNDGENFVTALESHASDNDFSIEETDTGTYNSFVDLTGNRTLGIKTNQKSGRWRIHPQYQLSIPLEAESGTYVGTLTYTII